MGTKAAQDQHLDQRPVGAAHRKEPSGELTPQKKLRKLTLEESLHFQTNQTPVKQ